METSLEERLAMMRRRRRASTARSWLGLTLTGAALLLLVLAAAGFMRL